MSKILITKFVILIPVFLSFILTADAQTVARPEKTETAPVSTNSNNDNEARIRQLEEQVRSLQEQINTLVGVVNQTPKQGSAQTETKAEAKQTETAKVETKQQKPLGVDIGSARLIPYGTIYFNAFSNTGGTNNADVPLFATPTGNAGNTSASVRQTRLGFRLEGARVGNANLKAVLEADFFGGFPSVGIGENFGVVRLRLANVRLDWEKTSVIVGQDWMPFAPVNPTSLAAAAIPQMAAGGNIWARIPQIKVERKLKGNLTLQGAILAPQTGDSATNAAFFFQPNSGASSKLPFFQTRVAFAESNWFNSKKSGSIGLSSHYGRSKVFSGATSNIENDIESLGVAFDWNIPLAERVSLAGEAFFGRNLGGFQAGVFQSYNNNFAYRVGANLIPGGVRAIGTRGGWVQLGFTPGVLQNRLSLYGSIGIDDPRDKDLVTITAVNFRSRNFVYAFDLIYKFTPQFQVAAEFRRFATQYFLTGVRQADHINLGAAYSF